MSQPKMVRAVTNRYGVFRCYRHLQPVRFVDYASVRLKRKNPEKKSKTVVEWEPRKGTIHKISQGTWGEMLSVVDKPVEELTSNTLHQLLWREAVG